MQPQLAQLIASQPILLRRDLSPTLLWMAEYALKLGELRQVLPGVYCAGGTEPIDWLVIVRAVCAYLDDAVITGDAAAALSFMQRRPVPRVEAVHRNPIRATGPVKWRRGWIPPEWIYTAGPIRITHPAWTAVDICGSGDSGILDNALRAGVGLDNLWRAFADMPRHRGNKVRRQLLIDSRDAPWSAAERLCHQILRDGGIVGWRTNHRIGDYYADITWVRERVIVEVDGFAVHGRSAQFQADRLRDQVLTAQGWTIIRVTWDQLMTDREGFIARLRQVLRRRGYRAAA